MSAGVDVVQVFVPAGSFVMGDEAVIGDNHKPPHDVALDAFWLDRTEVTNQMYAACVAAGVCAPPEPDLSGDPLLAEYPVVNVTWGDADAFCWWAGGRLPTEAEWEYAARGPEGYTYPWGEAPIPCADPAYDAGCNSLAAVESQPAAAGWVGALGMVGNAMEWVNDWYDAEYYARSPLANPPGPDSGRQRVVRGTTGHEPVYAAAAVRSVMAPDERYEVLGFRCARTEIATDTAAVTSTAIAAATATPAATTTSSPLQAGEGRIVMRGGVEVEQVYVPAGSFVMGSEDGLPQERPVHEVILDGFWIDRTKVTNAQFAAFVADTGYETPAESEGSGNDWQHPQDSSLEGLDNHPVVNVSWDDAQAYATWAGGRLPTEAEWEYAARGPEALVYPWGNEFDGRLNFCDRNCSRSWSNQDIDDGYAFTAPVGTYPDGVSWVGALDMAGNVCEWTNDWYDGDYYARSSGNNPTGPDTGEYRTLRGGSWNFDGRYMRAAHRSYNYPLNGYIYVGFRVVDPDA